MRFSRLLICLPLIAGLIPGHAAEEPPDEPAVAILPFEKLPTRADDDILQAGFAETLTTALARVAGLRVVERGGLKRILDELKL